MTSCYGLRVRSKRLLRSALRLIGKITICVIFVLPLYLIVSWCLVTDRTPVNHQLKTVSPLNDQLIAFSPVTQGIHSDYYHRLLCDIKAPSIVMNFSELMESTSGEEWLSYYYANTQRLSQLSAMQIVCSYHCFCDDKCVAFVHIEQSTHMCSLIHYTQTRCFPQPECFSHSEVSSGSSPFSHLSHPTKGLG